MVTLFQVNGALVYVEQDGTAIGYDDVFTRLEGTRRHSSPPASTRSTSTR